MELVDRILSLIRGEKQGQVARRIGLSPQQFNNILRGRNTATLETCVALARLYTVSLDWLILGAENARVRGVREAGEPFEVRGQTLKAVRIQELQAAPGAEPPLDAALRVVGRAVEDLRARPVPTIIVVGPEQAREAMKEMGAEAEQYVPVPYMEQAAAAGRPLEVVDERVKDFLLIHRRVARRPEFLFGVQIAGDSMEPRYPSGSIVVVDRSQADPSALLHRPVLIQVEGAVALKILNQGSSHWILESLNPKFRPVYVDKTSNPVLGRVIGAWVEEPPL